MDDSDDIKLAQSLHDKLIKEMDFDTYLKVQSIHSHKTPITFSKFDFLHTLKPK